MALLPATTFPKMILMKPYSMKDSFFAYRGELKGVPHSVAVEEEEGAFNILAKIQAEPAKIHDNYIHLRFYHINMYMSADTTQGFVVAVSNKPNEDKSMSSCTLFEPVRADDDAHWYLIHVHTGFRPRFNNANSRLVLSQPHFDLIDRMANTVANLKKYSHDWDKFALVDCESVIKLPKHVAFKGDNGKYLRATKEEYPYLQFSSDDPNDLDSIFEVQQRSDGSVRIKSQRSGKFWRLNPNWIWVDGEAAHNDDDVFWAVKINDETISLRNAANNNFCKRLSIEGKDDCLNAAAPTITREARLVVEELVLERKIYNVRYKMEEARIFNEKPYLAGVTTAVNEGDLPVFVAVELTYQDESSYSFTRGLSVTAGVSTTIDVGLPGIANVHITVSFEMTRSLQWDTTIKTTKTVKATGTVQVPPRSSAVVHYQGMSGTCNIPFTYSQKDSNSSDGRIVHTKHVDGIFNGVNCYNFEFFVKKANPLL